MVRLARCEMIDPGEVAVAHVMNRTCRRCFLFGEDPVSGKGFRGWRPPTATLCDPTES